MESVSPLGIWKSIKMAYDDTMSLTDPRVVDWYLTSHQIVPSMFIAVYIFMVYHLAPKIVRKHPGLDMRYLAGIFNWVMFFANLPLGISFSWYIGITNYSIFCQPVKGIDQELDDKILNVLWYYHVVKLAELGDTVFLILGKRKQSVPFVFVYHHISTVFVSWLAVKFIPGGSTAVYSAINTWVHVALYMYFKMSEHGLAHGRHFTKVIVIAQTAQFVLIIILCSTAIAADCGFPIGICKSLIVYMMSFILFLVPTLFKVLMK